MAAPLTIRFPQRTKDKLLFVSETEDVPMNKLVIQAVEDFVSERMSVIQEELESSLAKLKKYRYSDPDFEQAIGMAAEAELSTDIDPAQGEIEFPEDYEATALVRSLLNA